MVVYKNYSNVTELFSKLNHSSLNYVVLRNYENMHDGNFFIAGHEDIDLLVEDVDEFIKVSCAIPKMWPEDKIHLVIFINGEAVPLDVRTVGDGYYDEKWQKNIIDNRVLASNGPWYIMNPKDYYFSLVYHAILQKNSLSEEYLNRLNDMANQLGLYCNTEENHLEELDEFIRINGYTYSLPHDESVFLRNHGCEPAGNLTKSQRFSVE